MTNRLGRVLWWGGAGLAAGLGLAVGAADRRLARRETLDPAAAASAGQFVTVDGVRLHYTDEGRGEPGALPVLLLHGFAASIFSWRFTRPALAPHYRVLALDLQGFGFSERVTRPDYTLRRHADLVAGFLAAL